MYPSKFFWFLVLPLLFSQVALAAPLITTGPVSQSALVGTNPYFSVVASGSGTLTYQWQKDGAVITGGTTSTLAFSNVQPESAGGCTVVVTNTTGMTTSGTAILTVVAPAASPAPALPVIPQKTFLVTSYGVVSGTSDNTSAIQTALNAAKTAGGGIVRFPPGTYLSGPITVSSSTNLQLDYGATLKMLPYYTGTASSPPAGYYPLSGSSYTHFITIKSVNDVAITGQGTIDGQGQPWWIAYNANGSLPTRPRIVNVTGGNRLLVMGVTVTNSPSFHLAMTSDNMTVFGTTILASGTTPLNTDGMDPAGNHILIQNNTVSVGDDNVVLKPGGTFCSDITIANCTFGSGHGLSIGGQTNKGLNGMVVKNCTFNGTTTGLRMKADATQGGMVQNVTYTDLTMTNVPYPVLFYSYYNELGTPGSTGGSSNITPTIVNSWNGDSTIVTTSTNNKKTANQPINPLNVTTLSGWKNITVNNLTATGASGYSMIWGLPLPDYLIANVILNNVKITGGAGLKLYNATNVQITGSSSMGSYITDNTLAITSHPVSKTVNSGTNVSLAATVVGSSGLNGTAPTYHWKFNGNTLTNGANSDSSIVTGATTTTLQINNIKSSEAGSYALVASNMLDGYNVSTNLLVANSIAVSATSSAATISVVTPFSTFVTSYNLDPTSNGLPNADPDKDGIPNLLEFILGGNPTSLDPSILPTSTYTTINGKTALVYEFNENKTAATSVAVTVEYSTDLVTWAPTANGQDGVTITTTSVNATTNHVTVTILAGNGRVFARLRGVQSS